MDKAISMREKELLKWKSECGRYIVSISEPCFHRISKIAKKHSPREVGTSLVGCYSDDGFEAFILNTAPLSPDSKGSATSFYRGTGGLRKFLNGLLRDHGGRQYYIGEWHSHPYGSSTPSGIDDWTQSAIASDPEANCPECILIIFGGALSSPTEMGAFVYSRTQGRVNLNRV
jgi:hypothetical protein